MSKTVLRVRNSIVTFGTKSTNVPRRSVGKGCFRELGKNILRKTAEN